jgi:hypothetical protein
MVEPPNRQEEFDMGRVAVFNHLPVWNRLPAFAFWLGPRLVGVLA